MIKSRFWAPDCVPALGARPLIWEQLVIIPALAKAPNVNPLRVIGLKSFSLDSQQVRLHVRDSDRK